MSAASHPTLPGIPPLLVGRERELATLRRHRDAAQDGHGGLVLIGGEAGIGKTALVEAICREAMQAGALVLIGRCYDLTETPPYGPWVELFAQYRGGESQPPLPTAFAQPGVLGQVTSRAALLQQTLDFLTALTASRSEGTQPVILMLDDLHWADPASLDLLRTIARSLAPLPLLIIAAYRADEVTRRHPLAQLLPLLVRESRATRLDLSRLDADAVRALVAARYTLDAVERERLVAYLHERAEGNPFFVGELLRTLEAEGIVHSVGEAARLGDLAGIRVPPLLRQVIDGRLARLNAETQRLLTIAAVIGQQVPLPLWEKIADADDEALATALEEGIEARIVEPGANAATLRFVHALIREALYEAIVPVRRRVWHRRVGEALLADVNPDPDAVAWHFRQAGDERAIEWLVKAGERAERTFAWLTAAERYQAAIALLPAGTLGLQERGRLLVRYASLQRWADPEDGIVALDEALRLATEADDAALMVTARQMRGTVHCRNQDFRRGLADLEAAAVARDALSGHDRDRPQIFNPRMGKPHDGAHWGNLALWLAHAGRYDEAQAIGERVIAAEGHERDAPSEVHFGMALVYAARGQPAAARAAFARNHTRNRASGNHAGFGQIAVQELEWLLLPYYADEVREREALTAQALAAWQQASGAWYSDDPPDLARLPLMVLEGEWDEAYRIGLSAHAVQHRTSRRVLVERTLALLARHRGERDRARSVIAEWLPAPDAIQPGDVRFLDTVVLQRLAAALALDAGDFPTARAWLERHDAWLAWNGTILGRAESERGWARYYQMAGDPVRAYEHANRALAHASDPRQPLALLAAHRLLGELDTEAVAFDDAQQHLATSLALADACAAPFERALTLLARAELCAAIDDRETALTLIEEVRSICTPLRATVALAQVDTLASRLAMRRGSTALPTGLSAREVEVLRLVAAGQTNRQIAAALFLSPGTVSIHVTHILTKTGTTNRAEAAAFALRHGLA
jgi:DNA-binding CsgD family transcriptional regulator/tetratricopeptide (TPR) repeat protein